MTKITFNGQELDVHDVEVVIDTAREAFEAITPVFNRAMNAVIEVTQNLTLDFEYYRAMYLASLLEKHSPKKARRIRNMVNPRNPLKGLGLK